MNLLNPLPYLSVKIKIINFNIFKSYLQKKNHAYNFTNIFKASLHSAFYIEISYFMFHFILFIWKLKIMFLFTC